MNNAKSPVVSVPMDLFSGLYSEADASSLPMGASPLTVNCDYVVGSVKQRPGKRSLFRYGDLFDEVIAAFAGTFPGVHAPNEAPWITPLNSTLDTLGSYAEVSLNTSGSAQDGIVSLAQSANRTGSSASPITTPTLTPTGLMWPVFGYILDGAGNDNGDWFTQWPHGLLGTSTALYGTNLASQDPTTLPVTGNDTFIGTAPWASLIASFNITGTATPGIIQLSTFDQPQGGGGSGVPAANTSTSLFFSGATGNADLTPGNCVLVFISTNGVANVTPSIGGVPATLVSSVSTSNNLQLSLWAFFNVAGGPTTIDLANVPSVGTEMDVEAAEFPGGIPGATSLPFSQQLHDLNFPINLPSTANIVGFQVEVSGHQSTLDPSTILTLSLLHPTAASPDVVFQLPLSDNTVTLGQPTDQWGLTLTPALLNDPSFGFSIVASSVNGVPVTFDIYAVKIKVWLGPTGASINYLKTFSETAGEVLTLALDSNGVIYQEDAINNPNVLTGIKTGIQPDTFAESCTQADREFIAFSNLQNGTDVPLSYNGSNFDRLSQVGPGAAPGASVTTVGNSIISITQPTAKSDPEAVGQDGFSPPQLSGFLWSAGPGNTSPGNVLTVYYARTTAQPQDQDLQIGVGVALAQVDPSFTNTQFGGQPVNGNYLVVSIGQGVPPGAEFARWYFTVTMPVTQFVNQGQHQEGHGPHGTYQVTTATLIAASQVPNLEVGNQLQISGTGGSPPVGYDGSFTVLETPNAAQLQITSTQLSGNVASYGYNIITGSNPAVGEAVTVVNTLNGNGIFNVTNTVISAASAGSFSVNLVGPDTPSAGETGTGLIFGTIFKFDPLQVVGNKTGGNITASGIISAGVRKACYSFLTRNGYLTQPSPILEFDVPSGTASIVITELAAGPSNVIARVVHLTPAAGGNFYNIPEPVTVKNNGLNVINTSTWLRDNFTQSITLSFSDGVLIGASAIDIQGNNLFETAELGSPVGLIPYASRILAIGEQNKLTNLHNWSFDGGIGGGAGGTTYPLGWTADATSGAGGSVISSPVFGFAYAISNSSGSTQAVYGMLTQAAFEDEFEVPIIEASTTYSVRVTAAVPTGATTGNLVVDLFDPARSLSVGTFTLPLSSLQTNMRIFSGTLLTTTLAPIPNGLLLRLYATAILDGVQITIDRVEVFPTEQPNLGTQLTASYVNNFEAFDQLTGVVGCAAQNQQPAKSAFTLYDTLYIIKTGSFISTQDNGTTEPSGWTTRVVSNSVGTPSIYGVTTGIDEPNSGEEWAIIAGQAGAYLFNGGEPIKLTEEIQSLWNQINWAYGHTLWVKNDIVNRRILFGVPLKTPNTWLPTGIISDNTNPATPNVILELNYKQLNTANALADSPAVHRSYSGKLIASEITRKWSIWTIASPCAAFITRANTTNPIMLGNSAQNGKIYDLVEDFLQDDGSAVIQIYNTYGFVNSEQEQALQLGSVRKLYDFMTLLLDGAGELIVTAYPNSLDSPFAHILLPNIALPGSNDGDTEIPLNENASRLFLQFKTNAVGAGFQLSRLVMMLRPDPYSPLRGRN